MSVLTDLLNGLNAKIKPTIAGGNYTFPKDLNSDYFLMFNFCEYTREDLNSIGSAPTVAQVRLPIPTNITDAYGVTYAEEQLNTAIAGSVNATAGLDFGSLLGIGAGSFVAGALAKAKAAGGLQADFAHAAGAALPVASALSGLSLNPFSTVMFKSPQYKQYQFGWRLFPKNINESQEMQGIAELIRYHMLPDRSGGFGGAVLTWPSLIRCQIIAKGVELYPFKYGVVKDLSLNYAPDGAPSFYNSGKPTAMDLKVTIQEVEYFLKSSRNSSI